MGTKDRSACNVVAVLAGTVILSAGAASPASASSSLAASQMLDSGQSLWSGNGHALIMQRDGNLSLVAPGNRSVWSSRTQGHRGAVAINQRDGNLVVVAPGNRPVWSSRTAGRGPSTLVVQNDGNAVLYGSRGATWSVRTGATGPPPPPANTAPANARAAIVAIAHREASNNTRNHEVGAANCNFYSGALQAGSTRGCPKAWRRHAWCADFARWVWREAGLRTQKLNAGVRSFVSYGTRHGSWHPGSGLAGVRLGDAVVINLGRRGEHVALVTAISNKGVQTISGNAGNDTNRVAKIVYRPGAKRVSGFTSPIL